MTNCAHVCVIAMISNEDLIYYICITQAGKVGKVLLEEREVLSGPCNVG